MPEPDTAQPSPHINRPVFLISAGLIAVFVAFGAISPEIASASMTMQQSRVEGFGWFYIAAVAGFLGFAQFLMLSRYGEIKLGPDNAKPDYSYVSWFAMLFSAGMGIGLMFFGAAEPIFHHTAPPVGPGNTPVV